MTAVLVLPECCLLLVSQAVMNGLIFLLQGLTAVGMCPEVYICIDELKLKPEDFELDELYGVGL